MANTFIRDPRFGLDEAEADSRWSSNVSQKQKASRGKAGKGLKSALKKKPVYVINPYNQQTTDIGGDRGSPNRNVEMDRSVGHSDFGWGGTGEGDTLTGTVGVDELRGVANSPEENGEEDFLREEEEQSSGDRPKCICQWEWGWDRTCPVHGHSAISNAASAGPEDVYKRSVRTLNSRAKAAQFTTTNMSLSGGAHKFSIQRHAGVGNATAGVRKDDRGWWRDKSDYHDGEIKVQFKGGKPTNIVEEEEKEKLKFTPTDRVIGLQNRMKDSLNRAQSRIETNTKKIKSLEGDVKNATGTLKTVVSERAQSELDIMALKRGKVLAEATSLSSLRGERGSVKTANDGEEVKKEDKDMTHMPKHIRASYERDVDKLNHSFRVMGNMQREMRSAGR
ncbi:hypothetical protein TL16_g01786 [Triparma laevis f. inornata]|uniref:Uncharacterized protein n=1 Tax=Triparma laevis f. inornata TaxID=1714386 RepID=A0A9W6ZMX5_9STRA|nr:hypothetical protein TL16_g01786 [Triparma laevis f. inornata]